MSNNVALKKGFTQVCVWPACKLDGQPPTEFEKFMFDQFSVRIQYLEEVQTLPDKDEEGNPVAETGRRNDLMFAVHSEDVGIFAVPRLRVGIRWIEDALASGNGGGAIWPERLKKYCSWNVEPDEEIKKDRVREGD